MTYKPLPQAYDEFLCAVLVEMSEGGAPFDVAVFDHLNAVLDNGMTDAIARMAAIRERFGFLSIWSILEHDPSEPHPYQDATTVRYDLHWGGAGTCYATILGPSYLDLWVAADKVIRESGDEHHVFVEAFTPDGDELILSVGS